MAESHLYEVAQEYQLHYPLEYESFCGAVLMIKTMKEILETLKV